MTSHSSCLLCSCELVPFGCALLISKSSGISFCAGSSDPIPKTCILSSLFLQVLVFSYLGR